MMKIDLHIHTVSTSSDKPFKFSLDVLKAYVEQVCISAIAITNHNCFDLAQFEQIKKNLNIIVFPGIEINIENGHLLLISDSAELVDYKRRCDEVSSLINNPQEYITVEQLQSIFGDLSRYVIIPHYDKSPSLRKETLNKLSHVITAGEVSSPKKFIQCINDPSALVPVYFSDCRIEEDIRNFSLRQTYIEVGEITLSSIKYALRDKTKTCLNADCRNDFFDAIDIGIKLSSKLNVIIGERSSGKSYTLDRIAESFENVKYIRQFSLLERDEEGDKKRFEEMLSRNHSLITEEYLREFKECVDEMSLIDIDKSDKKLEDYIAALMKKARETELEDSFSKAMLFNETEFQTRNSDSLRALINSIRIIIDNVEYRHIIEKHLKESNMIALVLELINLYKNIYEDNLKKTWINDIITTIKKELGVRTAAVQIPEIDLYNIAIEGIKKVSFEELVYLIKSEYEILRKSIQGFQIVSECRPFRSILEMKSKSTRREGSFTSAFSKYDSPYQFLLELRKIENLDASEYYKFFTIIDYRILNKHGFNVSGGERSEFRLLQEISDAQQYDLLLIDEPESSFDNLFLKNEVNSLLKEISKTIPAVIVTHNNTVGASIQPDYIIFTKRIISGTDVCYEIYCGHPTDRTLKNGNQKEIRNFNVFLDCLEAGQEAYDERGETYEILKS